MRQPCRIAILCMLVLAVHVNAESLFDFSASTPEGSWVERETINTDHKGRQTVSVTKQKYLGSEQRQGSDYYWLETEVDQFKLQKGKRKRDGERMVMKMLVSAEAMSLDPTNVVNNMQGFGQEIIMQSGEDQPIRMNRGGMVAGAVMKAMGVDVKYEFVVEGEETISSAAGSFKSRRVAGSGETTSKILFKTMKVESTSLMWISDDVPFGIVQSESKDLINGKENQSRTNLLRYGTSGAVTAITGAVQEMPF